MTEILEGLKSLQELAAMEKPAARLPDDAKIDWEHVYLLGWIDTHGQVGERGRPYLTSWVNSAGFANVRVIVRHCSPYRVPLWKSAVPDGAQIEKYDPKTADKDRGFEAFGWYVPDGIAREVPRGS